MNHTVSGVRDVSWLRRADVADGWHDLRSHQAFNEQTAAQTKTMIVLTRAIAFLTVLMLVGLVVQIVLAT